MFDMKTIVLVAADNGKVGAVVHHQGRGWAFIPNMPGRRISRRYHETAESAVPTWAADITTRMMSADEWAVMRGVCQTAMDNSGEVRPSGAVRRERVETHNRGGSEQTEQTTAAEAETHNRGGSSGKTYQPHKRRAKRVKVDATVH